MTSDEAGLPPLIAIVGCDGSGKSTVSEALLACLKPYGPAEAAHLGKQQGNVGRSLASLPLIGNWFGGFIERKASRVRSGRKKNKAPDTIPGLVMYAFTVRRKRRYQRMMALRRKGLIVVADRYPQLDVPTASDGPDMTVGAEGNRFVQWLARREQRTFEWMTSYRPDLVVRLNIDADTAHARKPDHNIEALQRKIDAVPLLNFNAVRLVEIDASRPLEEVLEAARVAATSMLAECGLHPLNAPAEPAS